MRLLGASERALDLMCHRVTNRVAFGKPLAEQGSILAEIAQSRVDVDATRYACATPIPYTIVCHHHHHHIKMSPGCCV